VSGRIQGQAKSVRLLLGPARHDLPGVIAKEFIFVCSQADQQIVEQRITDWAIRGAFAGHDAAGGVVAFALRHLGELAQVITTSRRNRIAVLTAGKGERRDQRRGQCPRGDAFGAVHFTVSLATLTLSVCIALPPLAALVPPAAGCPRPVSELLPHAPTTRQLAHSAAVPNDRRIEPSSFMLPVA
jgi:hypothetical protein